MKKLLITAAAALAVCSAPLFAQTQNIVYGRTTITLSSAFAQTIAPSGAVITDLDGTPVKDNSLVLRENAGIFDPTGGAGEVTHTGGYLVSGGGVSLRLQDFSIDDLTPATPTVSATAVVNGKIAGRLVLFALQFPSNLSIPIPVENGVMQLNGFGLKLTPAASQFVNNLYRSNETVPNQPVGTLSTYSVLSPSGTL